MKTYVRKKREPSKRREPEVKRELILNAARELFAAQGYEDTPTAQIAEHANVSEGALFHQFKSKRDIYFRLAEQYGRECAAAIMPKDPGETHTLSIVRAAFDFADQNPALYRFFSNVGPKLDDNDATPMSDAIVSVIKRQIEWEIVHDRVQVTNSHIMAELQFALVDRAYGAWSRAGSSADRDIYIEEAARCMDAILH